MERVVNILGALEKHHLVNCPFSQLSGKCIWDAFVDRKAKLTIETVD